jgi:hypothetical protein
MAHTHGLGGVIDSRSEWCRWRDKKRGRPKEPPKMCRICGREWTPRNAIARGRRDICYRPECEKERERERRERRKARRRAKREKEA